MLLLTRKSYGGRLASGDFSASLLRLATTTVSKNETPTVANLLCRQRRIIGVLPWSFFEFLEKTPLFGRGQPLYILRQVFEILL